MTDPEPFDALAALLAAIEMVENNPPTPHQHLVSPTGRRCISCGEVIER